MTFSDLLLNISKDREFVAVMLLALVVIIGTRRRYG
jgi:hypothetical protein